MDLLTASAGDSADLVNQLRYLIACINGSISDHDESRTLNKVLEVLRILRDRAPELSHRLRQEVQELILEIEPVLSTIGVVTSGLGAAVAVVGILMQGFCKEKNDRRIGSQMSRYGGLVALGSFDVVSTIREVVTELKPALEAPLPNPAIQSYSASTHQSQSRGRSSATPRRAVWHNAASRHGSW